MDKYQLWDLATAIGVVGWFMSAFIPLAYALLHPVRSPDAATSAFVRRR